MIKLYRTTLGLVAEQGESRCLLPAGLAWDELLEQPDVLAGMDDRLGDFGKPIEARELGELLPPIVSQEVWAAGVTYLRSREARVQESQAAGGGGAGGDFYQRVYEAARPELFFKATPHRVVGPGGAVRLRSDSKWNVPEPELALLRQLARPDRRLHGRQRHEQPRHRGREPALPAAGEGLRRLLRPGPGRAGHATSRCRARPRSP